MLISLWTDPTSIWDRYLRPSRNQSPPQKQWHCVCHSLNQLSHSEQKPVSQQSRLRVMKKNQDLHGNAPDDSAIALLLIDVINDLDFEEGEELFRHALPAAKNIAVLKERARQAGVPVIYVNDNFGRWRSDFRSIVAHSLGEQVRGRPIAELLAPHQSDYFVLKPKHSGFFSTALDVLLEHLGVHTLVLTGFAGNNCVLFTAHDAYMMDYDLIVPSDCTASNDTEENEYALRQMQRVLKADLRPSTEINFSSEIRNRADKEVSEDSAAKAPDPQAIVRASSTTV